MSDALHRQVAHCALALAMSAGCSAQPGTASSSPPTVDVVDAAVVASPPRVVERPARVVEAPPTAEPIRWTASLTEGSRRALDEGAQLLVFVHADWSVPSVQMERDVWTDAGVQLAANDGYVAVKLDVSSTDEARLEGLAVRKLPVVLVLTAKTTRELARVEGYIAPADLIALLDAHR